MIFFFNANGVLMKSVPERVFQGSNKANAICVCAPLSETLTATISFRLPDGTRTAQGLMVLDTENPVQNLLDSAGKHYSVWTYDVPNIVTARAGTVTAQVSFTNSDGAVITTDGVSIIVEKGVAPITDIEDIDTLGEVLAYLSYLISTKDVSVVQETGDSTTAVMSQNAVTDAIIIEKGSGDGSAQQKVYKEEDKNPQANGLGAVALGGARGDKTDEELGENPKTTTANGIQAFATGTGTKADGNWSATFGKDTVAYRRQSIAIGGGTQAGSTYDEYIKSPTTAEKDKNENAYENNFCGAFATGELTKAKAKGSATFGFQTETDGEYAIASGYNSKAIGQASFASGKNTKAQGASSATFGNGALTDSSAENAIAMGNNSRAYGKNSFAGGYGCSASGDNSFAMGYKTNATSGGIAFGYFANASGKNSMAIGNQVYAKEPNQVVLGQRNSDNPNALLIVGKGVNVNGNAFEVLKDGRAKVYGAPQDDNDVVRKKDLSNIASEASKVKLFKHNVRFADGSILEVITDKNIEFTQPYGSALIDMGENQTVISIRYYPKEIHNSTTKTRVFDIIKRYSSNTTLENLEYLDSDQNDVLRYYEVAINASTNKVTEDKIEEL